jgi:hypothetical protein
VFSKDKSLDLDDGIRPADKNSPSLFKKSLSESNIFLANLDNEAHDQNVQDFVSNHPGMTNKVQEIKPSASEPTHSAMSGDQDPPKPSISSVI